MTTLNIPPRERKFNLFEYQEWERAQKHERRVWTIVIVALAAMLIALVMILVNPK